MRQDKEYKTQHQKEQLVNQFIINNGFLSSYNPVLIDDPVYQVKGVDLSCYNNNSYPIYMDFKLKNSNNFQKYDNWSVEIFRYTGYDIIDGWFIAKNQITNVYSFLEADSKLSSWYDIDSVQLVLVKKQKLISKIQNDTGKTLEDIKTLALKMMNDNLSDCLNSTGYFKRRQKLSDNLWLTMSQPDIGRPVINLCFNKNYLSNISANQIIKRR